MLPNEPIEIPKAETRELWLAQRRHGVGGSDAAAAVGMSKWMTSLELFYDKLGQLQRPETESMRWGTVMEPVIRQEYANQTGCEVLVPNVFYQHPKQKFALVNLDGIVVSRRRIFEAKTSRSGDGWGEPGTDEVPVEYNLQAQHGMAITGLPLTDIAVLIAGSDFRIYHVEADLELQAMLLEREAEFWRNVVTEVPPEPVSASDVKLRWRVASGISVTANESDVATVIELKQLKVAMKAAEEREEVLRSQLQSVMKDAASLVTPNGDPLATWKNVNLKPQFDVESFRAEQPDVYAKYLREPGPRRMFLLKVKG